MAQSRLQLHEMLEDFVAPVAVYFQAPTVMDFPCVKYERDDTFSRGADNIKYVFKKGYQVTVIDRNPDSLIPDIIEGLPHCRFERKFVVDGLHHFVFQLFF